MRFISLFRTPFLETLIRFDLAIACCAAFTGYILFPGINILKFNNISLIFCCGAILFTASKLFIESLSLPRWYFYALGLPTFSSLTYYLYQLPMSSPGEFWSTGLLLLGLIVLVFIAPFITRRSDSDDIWSYQFGILKNTLIAGIASLILILGLFLILFALAYLFSIKFYNHTNDDIFIVIAYFIYPVMALSGIPTHFEDHTVSSTGSILLKLLMYILIPLLFVYGIILHAYSLKIIITQELPRGQVSYLVAGFEICILIAYTLIQRWKDDHQYIRLFHRYVGWFMITPLILMAWGISERVSIFGLTEARYAIIVLWIWFAVSNAIVLFRALKSTLWIVGTLSGLLLICSIDPWSIQELPVKQQINRLKTVLVIIRASDKKTATKEQRIIVSTILDYLHARKRLGSVQPLYLSPNNLLPVAKLTPKNVGLELGAPYIAPAERGQHTPSYFFHYKTSNNSLPLQGYTQIIPNIKLSTYESLSHSFDIKGIGAFKASYSPKTHLFEIYQGNTSVYQVYMPDLINKLAQGSKTILHTNPSLTTQSKNTLTFQVIFTDLEVTSSTEQPLSINNISTMSFVLLVKSPAKK